jgi:hypothetical protein
MNKNERDQLLEKFKPEYKYWLMCYNISFKEMARQHREKGLDWFYIKKCEGYKKVVSPDKVGCFIMQSPENIFQVYSFNFFTATISLVKDGCKTKEEAQKWLSSNRDKFKFKL